MMIITTGKNFQIIRPSEGYGLAFRGDTSGEVYSIIRRPLSFDIKTLAEVKLDNVPQQEAKIIDVPQDASLDIIQQYLVQKTKKLLQEFLENNPITWNGEQYSVTIEKQNYLQSMILSAERAESLGISFTPTWNPVGGRRKPYSLKELQELFIAIQAYIQSLILQQQQIEEEILTISDTIVLRNYDIVYHLV